MQHKKLAFLLVLTFTSVVHAQIPGGPVGAVEVSPSLGTAAQATSPYAIAVGSNAIAGTTQNGGNPTLLINPAWAYENQIAIGNAALSWGQGDLAVGGGAVAVSQPPLGTSGSATSVGYTATSWGLNSSAFGQGATAGAVWGTSPTSNPTVSNATALGAQSNAAASNSTAVGAGATVGAAATGSVALGAGTATNRANTVEVGGRTVSGVANAVQAQDAVPLGQLQNMLAGIGAADPSTILNQANAYTDQAISSLRREYSRAIAAVAASPMLPALSPGERAVAVGGGFYNGQNAIGVTVGRGLENGGLVNAGLPLAAVASR